MENIRQSWSIASPPSIWYCPFLANKLIRYGQTIRTIVTIAVTGYSVVSVTLPLDRDSFPVWTIFTISVTSHISSKCRIAAPCRALIRQSIIFCISSAVCGLLIKNVFSERQRRSIAVVLAEGNAVSRTAPVLLSGQAGGLYHVPNRKE